MEDELNCSDELTHELLKEILTPVIQEASKNAMDTMGYIVIWKAGKVVKQFKDGTEEILDETLISR